MKDWGRKSDETLTKDESEGYLNDPPGCSDYIETYAIGFQRNSRDYDWWKCCPSVPRPERTRIMGQKY